ncbi:uncharacterized protein TNCV_2267721 [Trichonephila clavipes]|nr:uncharacterized protein TNCV_2267721 [Trichonephila clavipes]
MLVKPLARDTPPTATPDQLWQYVEATWTDVPQGYIQSLFDSTPRRAPAVIANKDGYTNYSCCHHPDVRRGTALARLRSGHLRSMTFVQGVKSFFTCPCSLLASPAHLLDCWGISLRQLYEEQDLVCETITRKGQMDLV